MAKTEITKSRRDHSGTFRATSSPPCATRWIACSSASSTAGRTGRSCSAATERLTVPELDVRENTNAIIVEAELPGVDEKDVTVTLANGMLTIKGEKKHEKEEKGENYHFTERSFGSFERSVRLPDTIDEAKVEAKFDKGVLKVTAAKKPEAVKAERKIEIKKT